MSTRKVAGLPTRKQRQISRLVVMNPSKGLNNLVSPSLIDDKEFSDSLNIEYDEGGVARKRSGYTQVIQSLTAAKGLGMFVTESVSHVCTVDDGTFQYASASSWTPVTTVSFTAGSETTFTTARNKLYIWNGTEGGTTWDGTTLARPGTIPKARFAIWHQSFHIASGVTGQPNRIYISATDDSSMFTRDSGNASLNNSTEVPGATVFTDAAAPLANFIDVRKDDGDEITGIGRFQDSVIIFKERAIFQLTFDSSNNPVITPVTGSTGCVSHKSIENVENDLYFLSREGVRVLGNEPNYFTAIRTNVLSVRIQTVIDSINPANYAKANAHYFDNKYILSVPTTSSSITKTIVYDRRFQAWSVWTNFNANAFIRYIDGTTNTSSLYFLDDDGIKVYEFDPGSYADDGEAIDAYIVSKSFDLGNPDTLKFFRDIGLVFRRLSGQLTISVYTDEGTLLGTTVLASGSSDGMGLLALGLQILGQGTGDTSENVTFVDNPERVIINAQSRVIKFKIQNARLNESFVLLGYILAFYPYSHFTFDSSRTLYL